MGEGGGLYSDSHSNESLINYGIDLDLSQKGNSAFNPLQISKVVANPFSAMTASSGILLVKISMVGEMLMLFHTVGVHVFHTLCRLFHLLLLFFLVSSIIWVFVSYPPPPPFFLFLFPFFFFFFIPPPPPFFPCPFTGFCFVS